MTGSVIVTGGFGALGQSVADAFLGAGFAVACLDFADRPSDAGVAGALNIGGVDLTDGAQADAAVATVLSRHGGIDILVNVAGGFAWETLRDGGTEIWGRMHAMNLITAVTATRAALPALTRSTAGRIISIGAGAAIRADAGMGAYAAAKAGVHRLTEALAAELRDTGMTVNAVLPDIIDTAANRAAMPDTDTSRWVQPAAVADVILFLASPTARAITGALIPVTRNG